MKTTLRQAIDELIKMDESGAELLQINIKFGIKELPRFQNEMTNGFEHTGINLYTFTIKQPNK